MRKFNLYCFIFGHDPLCEVIRSPEAEYMVETSCSRCSFKRRTSYGDLFAEAYKEMEKELKNFREQHPETNRPQGKENENAS